MTFQNISCNGSKIFFQCLDYPNDSGTRHNLIHKCKENVDFVIFKTAIAAVKFPAFEAEYYIFYDRFTVGFDVTFDHHKFLIIKILLPDCMTEIYLIM